MNQSQPEPDFGGMQVASFESRRADDIRRLIERYQGQPHVSPSMREVALEENRPSIDLANRIMTSRPQQQAQGAAVAVPISSRRQQTLQVHALAKRRLREIRVTKCDLK